MRNLLHITIAAFVGICLFVSCTDSDSSMPAPGGSEVGTGGSMARFTISGDYLYTVDNSSLNLFDISSPINPQAKGEVHLPFGVETIFPFQDKLFIGTQTGMHIMSIQNPAAPKHISTYEHVVSCDPVVTDGEYAYITLRSGTTCRQAVNQLQIVSLEDITQPKLLTQYDMVQPKGLGIDNNKNLFVCDDGLKMYDATDVMSLQLKQHFKIDAYDVIPYNNHLLVVGSDGFYQYQYTNESLELLSKIAVEPGL
ncbi:LVIVD repeat-containing protein [Pontibacter harenae]|uniref:LVIVD repeat-containing protein n=1 Tax=Pontibacter harenae TaxID=2894083 RepID=UPI001E5952BB|nr:hypothetical protein [Pontibacter harenae]MCC9166263.1 hypothetical protein [Pontibacter harenae]